MRTHPNATTRLILYPEKRFVTDAWVISQAKDVLATEYMKRHPESVDDWAAIEENARVFSVEEAIEILEDRGLVTFAR